MDEKILYIIFIVLWILYSIFGKNKKKKSVSSQQTAVGSQQPEEKKGRFTQLGEILLGDEFYELPKKIREFEPEPEPVFAEQKADETKPFLNSENVIYNKGSAVYELPIEDIAEEKEDIKINDIRGFTKTKFNLKQAIIYSAILNRPY